MSIVVTSKEKFLEDLAKAYCNAARMLGLSLGRGNARYGPWMPVYSVIKLGMNRGDDNAYIEAQEAWMFLEYLCGGDGDICWIREDPSLPANDIRRYQIRFMTNYLNKACSI